MQNSRSAISTKDSTGETLRDAHKALTRERIRSAAKELFLSNSAVAVTMEQIALAAGVSRPTVYVHFKDKDEIIADIVAVYARRVVEVNSSIAAPDPSVAEIRDWLERKVEFYRGERVSLSLLHQAGHGDTKGRLQLAYDMMTEGLEALAISLPAFRVALESGGHQPHARVRGEMLIRQITAACDLCAREGMTAANRAALDVTAEMFRGVLDTFERLESGPQEGRQ